MKPATRITAMTYRQVLGTRRLIGLLVLAVLPAVIAYLTTGSTTPTARISTYAGLIVGLFFNIVVPVVAIVLATSALGDDRRDRTLGFVVLRPVGRGTIAAAKLLGGTGAAILVTTSGAVALGIAIGLRGSGWGYLGALVVGTVLSTLAYGAVFTPLGYLTERATLAGFAYVFLWESAVAGSVAGLAATSLWRIGFSATAALAPAELEGQLPSFALGSLQPGAGGAVAKTLVLCAVGIATTVWLLRRRDHV